ncbi:MAG TPA: HAD-IIB family hydrolase, partial [Clostridia bacterium]|nr:HAD-IIB family hydrolase [Clostridia bacterium]
MYKVFATDIDNTLTQSAKEVSKENYDAIHRAIDAGIKVVLSTGRGYGGAIHVCRTLDLHGPLINYGGACINDIDTGEAIYTNAMPPALILELLDLAHELGIYAQIYQGDDIVYEHESEIADKYASFLEIGKIIDPDIRKKQWANVP